MLIFSDKGGLEVGVVRNPVIDVNVQIRTYTGSAYYSCYRYIFHGFAHKALPGLLCRLHNP